MECIAINKNSSVNALGRDCGDQTKSVLSGWCWLLETIIRLHLGVHFVGLSPLPQQIRDVYYSCLLLVLD